MTSEEMEKIVSSLPENTKTCLAVICNLMKDLNDRLEKIECLILPEDGES